MKKVLILFIVFLSVNIMYSTEFSPKLNLKYQMELADDLYQHGFHDEALELYIGIHNYKKTPKDTKAEALYLMGQISLKKKQYSMTIEDWYKLKAEYPEHDRARNIDLKIELISKQKNQKEGAKMSPIEVANDYYRHNFNDIAKEKFLDVYHDPEAPVKEKAEALYIVGQIIFEEGDYTLALEDWELLIEKFPNSEPAREVISRLTQIKDIVTYDSGGNEINILARAYLQNGDFWSDADREFIIDSSWMPDLDIAISWYDKIINEFGGTTSAEVAYRRKLFTLTGSANPETNSSVFGLKEDFKKYIPVVLETFTIFEREFPKSPFLQGFRYQIAQAYWTQSDWDNTRFWLRKIILAGDGKETFYTETARARLKKMIY